MTVPRVVVAGLRGGSGKTLVTLGLEAAWRRQGLEVAPFKKGPDYIDAAWATSAAGRPCRNLDLFLQSPDTVLRSFAEGAEGADIAVIEGNRGLFDGVDARGSFSTAELAKLLDAPVVLVVDCTKATRTVAAGVVGCQALDRDVAIRGVILNRVAGARHESVVRSAIRHGTGLPVLGVLRRVADDVLPERHLGLVPPAEHDGWTGVARKVGRLAERSLDLEGLATLAQQAPALQAPEPVSAARTDLQGEVRIGVFRDAAFQFYYPENLAALRRQGAGLVEISPLRGGALPDVHALYIGGGFPETLAAGLAQNGAFRDAVRRAAEAGLPVYAECGGAVYLGAELAYRGGRYPMAGVLPVTFAFQARPRGHGYTVLETVAENPFFAVGDEIRGHEFHYTYLESASAGELRYAFRVHRGYGFDGQQDGLCTHNVLASYTHVHALSAEGWAPALVRAADRFRSQASAWAGAGT